VSLKVEDRLGRFTTARTAGGKIAGELGVLLDKEFLAQDLPKFPPNAEKASKSHSEAI
jgi:hypothetical protein